MQCHLKPALGPEIRIGSPANIAQQTGRQPESLFCFRLVRKKRRDPSIQHVAMLGEAPLQIAFRTCCLDERIKRLLVWR